MHGEEEPAEDEGDGAADDRVQDTVRTGLPAGGDTDDRAHGGLGHGDALAVEDEGDEERDEHGQAEGGGAVGDRGRPAGHAARTRSPARQTTSSKSRRPGWCQYFSPGSRLAGSGPQEPGAYGRGGSDRSRTAPTIRQHSRIVG